LNRNQREFPKKGLSSLDSNGIKIAIFWRGPKMKLGERQQGAKLMHFLKFDIIRIE